ncbi:Uncharacterized protein APZ42_007597 [Daphnia magna]|uniref:Uncharacterized protein n=1 Tax=Daphnia magna TaxID=35525 RepID=A0A164F773_9CRUS|nr:Uncharacterized protein APZ42_007597 [Daphnia magna]
MLHKLELRKSVERCLEDISQSRSSDPLCAKLALIFLVLEEMACRMLRRNLTKRMHKMIVNC